MSICVQYNYQFVFILGFLVVCIHCFPSLTVSEKRELRDSFFVCHSHSETHI